MSPTPIFLRRRRSSAVVHEPQQHSAPIVRRCAILVVRHESCKPTFFIQEVDPGARERRLS